MSNSTPPEQPVNELESTSSEEQVQRSEKFTIFEASKDRFPWKTYQMAYEREHEVIEKYWNEMEEREEKEEFTKKEEEVQKLRRKHRLMLGVLFFILVILAVRYINI